MKKYNLETMNSFKTNSFQDSVIELTEEEKQLVNLWKRIVALSKNPRTTFRFGTHQKSNATGLFKFMDFCGIPKEQFIRSFLYQLQPFMIHLNRASSNKQDRFACIIDSSYRIPLWIEVIYKQFEEAVVSFHEMNWYDSALDSIGYRSNEQILCVPNSSLESIAAGEVKRFNISVLKGFNSFELSVYGTKVTNTFIRVEREEYERKLLNEVNAQLEDILHEVRRNPVEFPVFTKEKQISFTSFGEDLAMTVSMLLDLFLSSKDGAVSSVLAVKAQQLSGLPNGKPVIEELLRRVESYYGLNLNWLIEVRGD